jgi:hypothetical protein
MHTYTHVYMHIYIHTGNNIYSTEKTQKIKKKN